MEAINESSSELMITTPLLSNINRVDSRGEFKECMKNHAAVLGAHAVDGCGEFMPLPNSLTCVVCGCHRNFHRRVLDLFTIGVSPLPLDSRRPLPPAPPLHMIQNLTLNTSMMEQDHRQTPVTLSTENPVRRKRFRRKFTQVQKERMHSISEKAGWKMQGCNEVEVEELCQEIGITRDVLRIWMHNNKKTIGKISCVINDNTNIINESTSTSQ